MKSVKKILALVLAMLMVVTCFAACGGKEEPETTTDPATEVTEDVNATTVADETTAAPADRVGRYLSGWVFVRGVAAALGPYIGSLLFARLTDAPVLLWGILASFGAASGIVFAVTALMRSNKTSKKAA